MSLTSLLVLDEVMAAGWPRRPYFFTKLWAQGQISWWTVSQLSPQIYVYRRTVHANKVLRFPALLTAQLFEYCTYNSRALNLEAPNATLSRSILIISISTDYAFRWANETIVMKCTSLLVLQSSRARPEWDKDEGCIRRNEG